MLLGIAIILAVILVRLVLTGKGYCQKEKNRRNKRRRRNLTEF